MIVVVPEVGTFDTFERGLTGDRIAGIFDDSHGAGTGRPVDATVPLRDGRLLWSDSLTALGMKGCVPSTGVADLSGIDGTRSLSVRAVLHQATIAVDEKGTEASAATAMVIAVEE